MATWWVLIDSEFMAAESIALSVTLLEIVLVLERGFAVREVAAVAGLELYKRWRQIYLARRGTNARAHCLRMPLDVLSRLMRVRLSICQ